MQSETISNYNLYLCLLTRVKFINFLRQSYVSFNIHLKVLWIFKNIFEILHGLNDSDEKTKMLKTPS